MASAPEKNFPVLIVAPERVAERSAGPNIRAIAFAKHLAAEFDATLAVPEGSDLDLFEGAPFRVREWTRRDIPRWLGDYGAAVSQGTQYPARCCLGRRGSGPLHVFDLYNPFLFEHLASRPPKVRPAEFHAIRRLARFLFERGDYFLCASPRQRDLWLGMLYSTRRLEEAWGRGNAGRLPPDSLVGVAPFGHEAKKPRKTAPGNVLKGALPGIGPDDEVLLWGGGIWNWFDPETLLRAMALLAKARPKAKLFFLASRHPDEAFPDNEAAREAISLARELGLLGRNVFFNEGWTPLADRADYLLEADLAVCSAPDSPENHFSYRTRLVDAIWAGLPVVCNEGSFLSDYVESRGIGFASPAGDPKALAALIAQALEPEARARFRENFKACRGELAWERCVEPLADYLRAAARGELPEPFREPLWRPWTQYARYKIPTLLEKAVGRLKR